MLRAGFAGSMRWLDVTSTSRSSGVSATESGGPTTEADASTCAIRRGGVAPRSSTVTLSGVGGLAITVAPFTSRALPSLAEAMSCAAAGTAMASMDTPTISVSRNPARNILSSVMNIMANPPRGPMGLASGPGCPALAVGASRSRGQR
jgi:hypothetical protein